MRGVWGRRASYARASRVVEQRPLLASRHPSYWALGRSKSNLGTFAGRHEERQETHHLALAALLDAEGPWEAGHIADLDLRVLLLHRGPHRADSTSHISGDGSSVEGHVLVV
jgi:hypothetical protein